MLDRTAVEWVIVGQVLDEDGDYCSMLSIHQAH